MFRSPVVFRPYHGRDTAAAILFAVSRVFEDFSYEREIGAEGARHHALVFKARVGEREIHGCGFLHTDEHGLIDELTVMVKAAVGRNGAGRGDESPAGGGAT